MTTEQTFMVTIQTSNVAPPGQGIEQATPDEDYLVNEVSNIQFLPANQRQLFQFTLLADDDPEDTEAFQLSSTSGGQAGEPMFLPPNSLFTQTFIVIEDDDGK